MLIMKDEKESTMSCKFRVTVIESERGWGQKTEYQYFDTVEKAIEYRDAINEVNEMESVIPDWYMVAEKEIVVVED
jgi:hypothetical protein